MFALLDEEEVVLVETLGVLAPELVRLVGGRPAEAIGRDLERVLVEGAHVHDQGLELLVQKLDVIRDVLVLDLTLLHELDKLLQLRLQHAQTVGLDHLGLTWLLEKILKKKQTKFIDLHDLTKKKKLLHTLNEERIILFTFSFSVAFKISAKSGITI
jgi:hypothetical protein